MERIVMSRFLTGDWEGCVEGGTTMATAWDASDRQSGGYLIEAMACVACVYALRSQSAEAEWAWSIVRKLLSSQGATSRQVVVDACRADLALAAGGPEEALQILDQTTLTGWYRAYAAAIRGEAATRAGAPEAFEAMATAKELARDDGYARAVVLRAEGRLSEAMEAFEALPCPYQVARTALLI